MTHIKGVSVSIYTNMHLYTDIDAPRTAPTWKLGGQVYGPAKSLLLRLIASEITQITSRRRSFHCPMTRRYKELNLESASKEQSKTTYLHMGVPNLNNSSQHGSHRTVVVAMSLAQCQDMHEPQSISKSVSHIHGLRDILLQWQYDPSCRIMSALYKLQKEVRSAWHPSKTTKALKGTL